MTKQQYLVQKYVMASSVDDAIRKSKKMPIHEVYISSQWFEKVASGEFFRAETKTIPGFKHLSTAAPKA